MTARVAAGTRRLRWLALAVAFVVPPLALAVMGMRTLERRQRPAALPRLPASVALPPAPAHDPARPTVAVLLGADLTEITDALGPYEMFARAGLFNVYAVAAERQPTLLSGGLRILPHLSLAELDARLAGRPAAIVVVPMIPNIASRENRPLVTWMQRQAVAGALMHAWCTGAMALAEAGLLDGLTATAHWGDLDRLAERYPRVTWLRGVRWVDHGRVITSGGLTSGIDASLRVLSRTAGAAVAQRVARELRYPNYHLAASPSVRPHTIGPADFVLLANAAFRIWRPQIGIRLQPGVGELDLSNWYDAHSYSAAADLHAVGAQPGFIHTAHGLTLMPTLVAAGADAQAIRRLDRFVVPGQADGRFALEAVIEDLGRTADGPTARFALKRLEYRSGTVRIAGSAFPWGAVPLPLVSSLAGVLLAVLVSRARRFRRSSVNRGTSQAPAWRHPVAASEL